MKTTFVICGSLGLLLAACARNDSLPGEVTGAFEQAFNRDDVAACVGLFTPDAQILPQGRPVVTGHDGIKQFLKDQMTPVASFDTETRMTFVRGDLGIEQGLYRVRNVRRGSQIEEGKYLHVWRRMDDGWKLYRVMYSTDSAPETDVSVAQVE